jgi:hypothetical protein
VIEYSSVSTLRPECGVSGSTVESLTAEVRVNAAGQVLAVSGTYATDSSTLAGPCSTVESAEGTLVLHDVDPVSGQTRTATLTNPTGAGTLLLPLVVESTTTWSGASHCEDQQTETRRELFSLTYAREADGRLVFDRSESTTTLGCLDEVVEVTGVVIPE